MPSLTGSRRWADIDQRLGALHAQERGCWGCAQCTTPDILMLRQRALLSESSETYAVPGENDMLGCRQQYLVLSKLLHCWQLAAHCSGINISCGKLAGWCESHTCNASAKLHPPTWMIAICNYADRRDPAPCSRCIAQE